MSYPKVLFFVSLILLLGSAAALPIPPGSCQQPCDPGEAISAGNIQASMSVLCLDEEGLFSITAEDADKCGDDPTRCMDGVHAVWNDGQRTKANLNCHHLYGMDAKYKWSTPGLKSIGCTLEDDGNYADDPTHPTRTRDVPVIGGDYEASTHILRWYCGAAVPAGYKATLTAASGQPSGTTYTWTVVSGPATIESGQGTTEAVLAATDGSTTKEDITVKLTYTYGGKSCDSDTQKFTALEPTSLTDPVYSDTALGSTGFETAATATVKDQFNDDMADVDWGELVDNHVDDMPNNWPNPQTSGAHSTGATITDYMWAQNCTIPPSIPPQNPLGTTKVFHQRQRIYIGAQDGTGCLVRTQTQQFYTDHARWE